MRIILALLTLFLLASPIFAQCRNGQCFPSYQPQFNQVMYQGSYQQSARQMYTGPSYQTSYQSYYQSPQPNYGQQMQWQAGYQGQAPYNPPIYQYHPQPQFISYGGSGVGGRGGRFCVGGVCR